MLRMAREGLERKRGWRGMRLAKAGRTMENKEILLGRVRFAGRKRGQKVEQRALWRPSDLKDGLRAGRTGNS